MADTVLIRRDNTVPGTLDPGRLFIDLDDGVLYFGATSGVVACLRDGATITTGLTFSNTGLHILDTNASHDLILSPGSDLTADRTLTITTGDSSRTLTMTGNASISGTNTGDQTSVTGNAGTATALQTARTIGGVSFDGTANIVPQTIQSVNEATDTSCFLLFITASGSQSLQPMNNANLTFDSATGTLGAPAYNAIGTFASAVFRDTAFDVGTYMGQDGAKGFAINNRETGKSVIFQASSVELLAMNSDGIRWKTQSSSSSSFSLNRDATIVFCTGTGSTTQAVDIPSTVISQVGRMIVVIDSGGAAATRNITITTQGSQTINGSATYVMNVNRRSVVLASDGSNLCIMAIF